MSAINFVKCFVTAFKPVLVLIENIDLKSRTTFRKMIAKYNIKTDFFLKKENKRSGYKRCLNTAHKYYFLNI